jgi:Domain of unknown function (DUF6456)
MVKVNGRGHKDPRVLIERPLPQDGHERGRKKTRKPMTRSVSVNLAESPLGWLHSRGYLTDRQFDAGEKLRMDWERANLSPSVTMRWDVVPLASSRQHSSAKLNQTEAQIAAKHRFDQAIEFIGKDLSDISWRVICGGEGVPAAEKKLGWPARSGKLVLKIALDRLGNFYRLPI